VPIAIFYSRLWLIARKPDVKLKIRSKLERRATANKILEPEADLQKLESLIKNLISIKVYPPMMLNII
jgi:hypothetical protein